MRSMLPDWNETFEDGAAVFYDEPLFPVSLDSTGCVKNALFAAGCKHSGDDD